MKEIKQGVIERFDILIKPLEEQIRLLPNGIEKMVIKTKLISDFMENDFKKFCIEEFSKFDNESLERDAVDEGISCSIQRVSKLLS